MKMTVNIDCTPEEARTFFGLPDVQPMQKEMMDRMQERMNATLDAMTPEAMFKALMPAGVQGMEQMQKMWAQFQNFSAGGKSEK